MLLTPEDYVFLSQLLSFMGGLITAAAFALASTMRY